MIGVDGVVEIRAVVERAGDDQRRARLVDQDRVHLVDDGVDMAALHHVLEPVLHVVAQIVEAELVVGAVGDVARIGGLALLVVEPVHDHADGEPEEAVDLAHPFGVALGEVVVDGHDMHAPAGERVEVHGSVATSVLPSPVFISEILPSCRIMPPISCTSKWRWPSVRLAASRHGREGRHQDVVEGLAVGELLSETRRCARAVPRRTALPAPFPAR